MKLPSLVTAIVISSLGSAFAITDAEIAPAALAGKTLTFTIINGGAPYATNGTWSGAFAASGNAFAVAKITGDTVDISTTFTAALNGTYTDVSLGKFIEGRNPATLTLYTTSGVGYYEVAIQGLFGVSLNGTFTIGSAVVKAPEINVLLGGNKLIDGSTKLGFGTVKTGTSGNAAKFVIKNSGKSKLTGLAITKNGANKSDFTVTALAKTSLAAGDSMTFKVAFKPSSTGKRSAAIHISSNDANEGPFDIKLAGVGAN
jgi:Abnormal spindle-like microcephaly-assoc'd, ASPM-SPD-2-Hydin